MKGCYASQAPLLSVLKHSEDFRKLVATSHPEIPPELARLMWV